jgi:hypothetical protein
MAASISTENLINSFPMFGHPGISALEYAGTLAEAQKSAKKVPSSLRRKSTVSTQYENTTAPATAGTEVLGNALPQPVHYIDELGCQRRRKDTFMNHTPRNFEMRITKKVEVYRPSTSSSENYSRPRVSIQGGSAPNSPMPISLYGRSSAGSHAGAKRLTINEEAPAELDSTEVGVAGYNEMPEVYRPVATPCRRSASNPMAKIITYQPRTLVSTNRPVRGEGRERSTSTPVRDPVERRHRECASPYALSESTAVDDVGSGSLQPWVIDEKRNMTNESLDDMPTKEELRKLKEVAPLGVIQRYFDSQVAPHDSYPGRNRHLHTPSPPNFPLPASPEPALYSNCRDPLAICTIEELDIPSDLPPAVPDRSPKRLTHPKFPNRNVSITSVDSDFVSAAQGQYSEYEKKHQVLYVHKKRSQKHMNIAQAARAGSSNLGRMAPPILGHDALTASSDLGLNDLSYYLKHTGPATEPQPMNTQRGKNGKKMFRVKRKSLAARVGSVEGSPQRARQKPKVPACAREMTTSGGARHLRIIIPTEKSTSNLPACLPQRRSRHIAISFTEEMLSPLASPAVEHAIQGLNTHERSPRSFSAPNISTARTTKRAPVSPRPVPVLDHPLAMSREEQTKARKIRDLKKLARKESTAGALARPQQQFQLYQQQHLDTTAGATLNTPAQTPERRSTTAGSTACNTLDEREHEVEANVVRLKERAVQLQRQNTELTEALARIVGLELENGDLEPEQVLQAFRQCRMSRTPSGW